MRCPTDGEKTVMRGLSIISEPDKDRLVGDHRTSHSAIFEITDPRLSICPQDNSYPVLISEIINCSLVPVRALITAFFDTPDQPGRKFDFTNFIANILAERFF